MYLHLDRFSDNGGNGELNFKQIAWEVREFGMSFYLIISQCTISKNYDWFTTKVHP